MEFKIRMVGTHALLMHNSRLSNPIDPFTRRLAEVTSKRKKTEEDHVEIAQREWDGSLYYDPDAGIHIPGQNVERALLDSARMDKLGKTIQRGVFITDDKIRLVYPGPQDLTVLRKDENFRLMASVKVGMSRTMRCRPIFQEWSLEADGFLDEEQLDLADLQRIAVRSGRLIGLGDWRPRYGRFEATIEAA
jgi:hypothetical protein